MYCERCGNKTNENESFCSMCGNKNNSNYLNQASNTKQKSFHIGKCYLICIGIAIGVFLVTTIIQFILGIITLKNSEEVLSLQIFSIIKFYIPILIIIFGPFILYAIKNSNKNYN